MIRSTRPRRRPPGARPPSPPFPVMVAVRFAALFAALFAASAAMAPGVAPAAPPSRATPGAAASKAPSSGAARPGGRPAHRSGTVVVPDRFLRRLDPVTVFFDRDLGPAAGGPEDDPARWVKVAPRHPRSEERRVGKEGRSRWSPYH